MEHTHDRLDEAGCRDLLARSPQGDLAGTTPAGLPVLRTLHHVLLDGALWFHGAPRGEKLSLVGRPVVFGCHEVVARLPSHWLDPARAGGATTFFRSVQVRGTLRRVEDPGMQAAALRALMEKLQPEGGYAPLTAGGGASRTAPGNVLVLRLELEELTGREKLGQNRRPEALDRILSGLWERGGPGDLEALEVLLARNPRARRPDFLRGPEGTELLVHADPGRAREAAALLGSQYWNRPHGPEALVRAQLEATAWVGAREPGTGALVATAAALSNRVKHAWIHDVAVAPAWRGRGLGSALLQALLDHPALRGVPLVALRTRDAQDFYRPLGFVDAAAAGNPTGSSTMLRCRLASGEPAGVQRAIASEQSSQTERDPPPGRSPGKAVVKAREQRGQALGTDSGCSSSTNHPR